MGARPWLILAALALGRIGFGYQFQTVGTLGPDLVRLFHLDYTTLGALIGSFMLLGSFAAIPLGLLGRRFGDRLILGAGLGLMVVGPLVSAASAGPGDRHRSRHRRARRGGDDRAAEQDHRGLVPWAT